MGERFAGRYELLDPLGEGGMASVWRAWDERERRVVAVKVLRQSDAVSLLRFVREQAVRVANPHVLAPIGWAGEDDRVLFTMPIVDGGSVATLAGDYGPLPPRLVAELLRQLFDALSTVHRAGFLHRDVKPANLLLVATGHERPHLMLSDFGIAVDIQGPRFTQTGEFVGTPGFVAPEVLGGAEPHVTADLYAAGQVGLYLLTGMRGTPAEQAQRRPDGVADSLWDCLLALTATDPALRPQSAAEAIKQLSSRELAWDDAALGDVEVLRHVPEDPEGRPQLLAQAASTGSVSVRTAEPDEVVREPDADPERLVKTRSATAVERPSESPTRRRRPAAPLVALAALAVLGVAALLVAWSPWRTAGSGGPPTIPPSASSSPPPTTTASASPTFSASATTAVPSSASSTPGTVGVGTVVSNVGQPCTFTEVGRQERTPGGVAVVCQRRADGSYAWDPAPR